MYNITIKITKHVKYLIYIDKYIERFLAAYSE